MDTKKKLIYSVNFALFITGILLSLISEPDGQVIKSRFIISIGLIVISYFIFPFLEYEKKEKLASKVGLHCVCTIVCLFILYYSLSYYVNHLSNSSVIGEILSAIGLILCVSYISFVFIGILKTIYTIILRIKAYLFKDNVKSEYSAFKSFIEGFTALLIAITTMIASTSALLSAWNALFKN